MGKDNKNGILCLFALACVAILLSTSLVALTGNDTDSNRRIEYDGSSCYSTGSVGSTAFYESIGLCVDDDGLVVATYDGDDDFAGEKELVGERIPSNDEIDAVGLTFELHSGNTLWVTDYDGGNRNIVVPDTVMIDGQYWTVTKIDEWGLSTHSPLGRHPYTVEIGSTIEVLAKRSLTDEWSMNGFLQEFKIRDIEHSRLKTICEEAFYDTQIKSIELPKSLEVIEQKAFKKSTIKNVTLHSEKLDIGFEAFMTTPLNEINLENVRHIGSYAFRNTYLTNLDLSSARHIGDHAFAFCNHNSDFFSDGQNAGFRVKFSPELESLHEEAFVYKDYDIGGDEYFHFFDSHGDELEQCAQFMKGRTFGTDCEGPNLDEIL